MIRRAGPNNRPKRLSLWHCISRNAILKKVSQEGQMFGFERVISLSKWHRNQLEPGVIELIHLDNLGCLVGPLSEMEVIARCARD